jgi:hypothetical protein
MSATIATVIAPSGITPAQVQQAREFLQKAEAALAIATEGLSQPQWHHIPAPGQWSISGILEHCALVQQAILGPIRQQLAATPAMPNPDAAAVDEIILTCLQHRSIKAEAPEFLHPRGCLAPEAAWNSLRASNVEMITWLEDGIHLRQRCIPGPPVAVVSGGKYGMMDGFQWILAAAGHLVRHTAQILEIRDCPSFPAV